MKKALEDFEDFNFVKIRPVPLPSSTDEAQKQLNTIIWTQQVKDFTMRQAKYEDNMNKAYALIWGQCTIGLKNKLEARKDWKDFKQDPIKLLKAIKEITHNYQDSRYPISSIYKSLKTVLNIEQQEKETLATYTKRFKNATDIMETQHGKLNMSKYIKTLEDYDEDDNDICQQQSEEAYDRFIAFAFIKGADPNRSGKLDEDLSNQFALGQDMYPTDLANATKMIINYQNKVNNPNIESR